MAENEKGNILDFSNSLDNLSQQMEDNNNSVESNNKNIERVSQNLNRTSHLARTAYQDLGNLKYNFDLLKSRVKENETILSLLNETTDIQGSDISSVSTQSALNKTAIKEIKESLNLKADNLIYENNTLYLMSGDQIINSFEIISAPSGGGGSGEGSGGGGTTTSNMTAKLTSDYFSSFCTSEDKYPITFSWSSIEDGYPTGSGVAEIRVDDVLKATQKIEQGNVELNLKSLLDIAQGTNEKEFIVKVMIYDSLGNSKRCNWRIKLYRVLLTSTFKYNETITGKNFSFKYNPFGVEDVEKIVHFIIDGQEVKTVSTLKQNLDDIQTINVSNIASGAHELKVYFTQELSGTTISSNTLTYTIPIIKNNESVLLANIPKTNYRQYEILEIPINLYNIANATVKLFINNQVKNILQVEDFTTINYTIEEDSDITIKITAEYTNTTGTYEISTTPKIISIEAAGTVIREATDGLELYLSSKNRNNSELNPYEWSYTKNYLSSGETENKTYSCTFENIDLSKDLWQSENGSTACRLTGDARLIIPYKLFETNFAEKGKTIEIEFSTKDIIDYDTVLLDCSILQNEEMRGLQINAHEAKMITNSAAVDLNYKENEKVRISYVFEPSAKENSLILCYINGIISRAIANPENAIHSLRDCPNIVIGSNECVTDIYSVRIYDHALDRYEVVSNWIFDTVNATEKYAKISRNDVYDNSQPPRIVIDKLPKNLPYMVLWGEDGLPTSKGSKKTVSGYFIDPTKKHKDFDFVDASFDVQGTSSQGYPRKNFKAKFKDNGFEVWDVDRTKTTHQKKYAIDDEAIEVSTFCFKADVASSEGGNNTILATYYNDLCRKMGNDYLTPPQKLDSKVRQGIEGFPMVIFWKDENDNISFIGKYNFNNDKGTEDVYGFKEGDQSWEVCQNPSPTVRFQAANFYKDAEGNEGPSYGETEADYDKSIKHPWEDDFESRFPDYEDIADEMMENDSNLHLDERDIKKLEGLGLKDFIEVVKWVVSTDTKKRVKDADGNTIIEELDNLDLPSPVTYNNVTYTKDNKEYRLAKFKNEFGNYFNKNLMFFYYLFTETFLMIDSRAKNMFMTRYSEKDADGNEIGKWFTLPYDFDTALGINNEGLLTFGYDLEDTSRTANGNLIYNCQDSVLWENLRDCFPDELAATFKLMVGQGFTYNTIDTLFTNHQAAWPEVIFNEDSYYKYIEPYDSNKTEEEKEKTGDLYMLQGSKAMQRKFWLYNRFRYMISRYGFDTSGNLILLRSNINELSPKPLTLETYTSTYIPMAFASSRYLPRVGKNETVSINVASSQVGQDVEFYIYNADQLLTLGKLAPFDVHLATFPGASRLRKIDLGNAEGSNEVLTSVELEGAVMVKEIDLTNCTNCKGTLETSSPYLEILKLKGTKYTSISVPDNGNLKEIYLPSSLNILSLKGHRGLYKIEIEKNTSDKYNITNINIQDCGNDLPELTKTASNSRQALGESIKDIIVNSKGNSGFQQLILDNYFFYFENLNDANAFLEQFKTIRDNDTAAEDIKKTNYQLKKGIFYIQGTINYTDTIALKQKIKDLGLEVVDENTGAIKTNLEVKADTIKCTIKFADAAGNVFKTIETPQDKGDLFADPITEAERPQKAASEKGEYEWIGWDPAFDNEGKLLIEADTICYPIYKLKPYRKAQFYSGTSSINPGRLLYTLYSDNFETIILTDPKAIIGDFESPMEPSDPSKEYAFDHWTITSFGTEYSSDLVVYTVYKEVSRQCDIKFYNDDGTSILYETTIPYGTIITYDGEIPKSVLHNQSVRFSFLKWQPELPEGTTATIDASYTAKYTEINPTMDSFYVNLSSDIIDKLKAIKFSTSDRLTAEGIDPTTFSIQPEDISYMQEGMIFRALKQNSDGTYTMYIYSKDNYSMRPMDPNSRIAVSFNLASSSYSPLTSIEGFDVLDYRDAISLENLFYNLSSIQYLDLSSLKVTNKLVSMSNMFSGCESLSTIIFPSVSNNLFNTVNVTNMERMFYHCFNLTNLDLSKFNFNNVRNTSNMFGSTYLLENIHTILQMPKLEKTQHMFDSSGLYCIDAANLNFDNANVVLNYFNNYVFEGIYEIKNLHLGENFTNVHETVNFFGDPRPLRIHITNITPLDIDADLFAALNKKELAIFVPVGTLEAYKIADKWKDFNLFEEGTEVVIIHNDQTEKFITTTETRVYEKGTDVVLHYSVVADKRISVLSSGSVNYKWTSSGISADVINGVIDDTKLTGTLTINSIQKDYQAIIRFEA